MATQKKATATPPETPRYAVDEVHVQLVVREIDGNGETTAKHATEPIRFVSERAFREWAAQPFEINRRDETPG